MWLQWRALGAQTATRADARSMVDPEALVLMSLALTTTEPRLRDVMADWVVLNASLLGVQRIKNLIAHHPGDDVQARVGAFAYLVLSEAKDVRWRSMAMEPGKRTEARRRTNKLRAREASFDHAAALWLKLRLALSVGIKADTMAFLLGSGDTWASGRAIARATSYTLPAVRRAIADLSHAGLVFTRDRPQSAAEYAVRRQSWVEAFGLDGMAPVWRNWHERFAFVTAFLAWGEKGEGKTVSKYAFGALGRDLLDRHAFALDEVEGVETAQARRKTTDWPAAVERTVRHFTQRLVRDA